MLPIKESIFMNCIIDVNVTLVKTENDMNYFYLASTVLSEI